MKIAVSAQGPDLNSPVDPRFGRAAYFIIYDTDSRGFDVLRNVENAGASQGAGIQAAQANVAAIQAELDLLQAPPSPESIAVAEAEVKQAEAALAVAQVALARTELRAPFDGVITQVFTEVGENVGAGQPVFILANVDHLQLTTIDLVERNIVGLTEGQVVQVTVDALPDRTFDGRITQIKQQSTDYRGDVTYPVTIQLEESTPELRWGMRAVVEIP